MNADEQINLQRKQVFELGYHVTLHDVCTIGNGIMKLSEDMEDEMIRQFEQSSGDISFFIPASGSGSRMFQFLFEWLENEKEDDAVHELFEKLDSLAFARPFDNSQSKREYLEQLIAKYAHIPKGLIPFHKVNTQKRTAFQEHVVQAKQLTGDKTQIHFTVQQEFERDIVANIEELGEVLSGVNVTYSYQKEETDAYCFNEDGSLFMSGDIPLRRPAGHGALLDNLSKVRSNTILVKNIDNIQHEMKAELSNRVWKISLGLLESFKKDLSELGEDYSHDDLKTLNERYQFLSSQEVESMTADRFKELLLRPCRVAGMVKNEGEPGGGPFWIDDNGTVTKQIIEKVQIDQSAEQQEIVQGSSHFNPVFLALSTTDASGNQLDLMKFRDDSKHFVVRKSQQGVPVLYRELPGLWNGSMGNWNTLFLEIPSEVFSPVKTILDLAKPQHQHQA